jgi:hypothetical protein
LAVRTIKISQSSGGISGIPIFYDRQFRTINLSDRIRTGDRPFCLRFSGYYQTSDTSINSTARRRLVATQGMLSYFLSVSIIAIIFGMIGNLLSAKKIFY